MKLLVPAEQSLSMALCAADALGRGAAELRILTGLLKLRACRDNVVVATGAMEARGGNGYIEDWVNPRLIRDAQVGLLWEGTSNINALDVIGRAVGKSGAHRALQSMLQRPLGRIHNPARAVSRRFAERAGSRHRPCRTSSQSSGRRRWLVRPRRRYTMLAVRCCWRGKDRARGRMLGEHCCPASC